MVTAKHKLIRFSHQVVLSQSFTTASSWTHWAALSIDSLVRFRHVRHIETHAMSFAVWVSVSHRRTHTHIHAHGFAINTHAHNHACARKNTKTRARTHTQCKNACVHAHCTPTHERKHAACMCPRPFCSLHVSVDACTQACVQKTTTHMHKETPCSYWETCFIIWSCWLWCLEFCSVFVSFTHFCWFGGPLLKRCHLCAMQNIHVARTCFFGRLGNELCLTTWGLLISVPS